jgi:hypothetical protein
MRPKHREVAPREPTTLKQLAREQTVEDAPAISKEGGLTGRQGAISAVQRARHAVRRAKSFTEAEKVGARTRRDRLIEPKEEAASAPAVDREFHEGMRWCMRGEMPRRVVVAARGGAVECGLASGGQRGGIGACSKERLHAAMMAVGSGHVQWRRAVFIQLCQELLRIR